MQKQIYWKPYRSVIEQLRAARIRQGLSQRDAARRAHVSRQWLTKIEQCELRIDLLHLIVMCRVYGIKAHKLVQKMEEEPSDEDGFFFTPWRARHRQTVTAMGCGVILLTAHFGGHLVATF